MPWAEVSAPGIGSGGQGDVIRVEAKPGTGFEPGQYALKRLRNVKSEQARARFIREIEAVQRVEDPRVVRIIDAKAGDGHAVWYYVMPFYGASYSPLSELAHSDDSPFLRAPSACLRLIGDCAEALVTVHNAGVVHRDIKPENILVHRDTLAPILLDFGCCQLVGGDTITFTDEGVGTRNYMAPECEAGVQEGIDPRADLYSLGKLLWVLVTGRQPFAREKPVFAGQSRISVALPEVPDSWHLIHVLERTVRRDPSNRFGNAGELARECRRLSQTIIGRFPPLELVHKRCPACGHGEPTMRSPKYKDVTDRMHMIFGNHQVDGVRKVHCDSCGFIYAFNWKALADRDAHLQELE